MRRQATPRRAVLLAACALAAACGAPGAGTIDREIFIEAYVELRLAALQSEDFEVAPEQRAEILARHGVDKEGLLRFADVHGRDVDFMNEVWSEVERRLEERRPDDDTA
ncbi:MAG TPA: hypothetical protein VM198_14765 [Longimicrobiales bacterium]|nr:hypothetical protein [Longimicrobiales bacterium]